eukprot:7389825-Prymnesium_polylepis.1
MARLLEPVVVLAAVVGLRRRVAAVVVDLVGVRVLRLEAEHVDLRERVGVEMVDVAVEEDEGGAVEDVLLQVGADEEPVFGREVPGRTGGARAAHEGDEDGAAACGERARVRCCERQEGGSGAGLIIGGAPRLGRAHEPRLARHDGQAVRQIAAHRLGLMDHARRDRDRAVEAAPVEERDPVRAVLARHDAMHFVAARVAPRQHCRPLLAVGLNAHLVAGIPQPRRRRVVAVGVGPAAGQLAAASSGPRR